jgi:hypothetical protein
VPKGCGENTGRPGEFVSVAHATWLVEKMRVITDMGNIGRERTSIHWITSSRNQRRRSLRR